MSGQSHPNQSDRITLPPIRTVLPPGSLPPPAGYPQHPQQQQAQYPGYYAQPGHSQPSHIQRGQTPAPAGHIPPAPRMGPPPVPMPRAQTPAASPYGVFGPAIPHGQQVSAGTIVRRPQPGGGTVAPPRPKNFVCTQPGCGKAFERQGHLDTHMNSHGNIRPYKCQICHTDFTASSNYKRHMRDQHGMAA
ncbi:hypothetical protein AURDEDRAFT_171612 [Auricularia subglabra TFB-10046 SS5]|nr:hypothetical protein AURDEDRAFT_171612 [Auricularia subglabra TFB-10046 SS5]